MRVVAFDFGPASQTVFTDHGPFFVSFAAEFPIRHKGPAHLG